MGNREKDGLGPREPNTLNLEGSLKGSIKGLYKGSIREVRNIP